MSGKYIPPSRRKGFKAVTSDVPPGYKPQNGQSDEHERRIDGSYHTKSILHLFGIPQDGTFNYFSPPLSTRLSPETSRNGTTDKAGHGDITTTPDTEIRHPLDHLIAYILIFANAHPLWEAHSELWTHTDAWRMIEDEAGPKMNFDRPIPVYTTTEYSKHRMVFNGWW